MAGLLDFFNSTAPDKSGGLLGGFGDGGMAYSLMGAGAGMLSGESKGDAWGKGFQGFMSGAKMDMERRKQELRKKVTQSAINPDGSYDFQKIAVGLGQMGDIEGAMNAAKAAEMKAERERSAKHQDRSHNLEVDKFNHAKTKPATEQLANYKFAVEQGFKGSFTDYIDRQRAGAGEFGLNGYWGVDEATGDPAVMQLGKSGKAVKSQIPEGFRLAKDPIKMDAGTHFILLDPQTRQPVGRIEKDIVGKERQEEIGKTQGQAQSNLSATISSAEQSLKVIDDLIKDPNREMATGLSSWTQKVPSTGAYDYGQKVKQLQGRAFLEAYQNLKGGGAITEAEGQKAEQAIARLSSAQTEKGFVEALNDLKQIIQTGIRNAKIKAGAAGGGTSLPDPLGIR